MDIYDLRLAARAAQQGSHDRVTIVLCAPRLPVDLEYLVVSGIESCVQFATQFKFGTADLAYLRLIGFSDDDVHTLEDLRFTGDIRAVPDGRIVLAGEPLIEISASLPEAFPLRRFILRECSRRALAETRAVREDVAAGKSPRWLDPSQENERREYDDPMDLLVYRLSGFGEHETDGTVRHPHVYHSNDGSNDLVIDLTTPSQPAARQLLEPFVIDGERIREVANIDEARHLLETDLDRLKSAAVQSP